MIDLTLMREELKGYFLCPRRALRELNVSLILLERSTRPLYSENKLHMIQILTDAYFQGFWHVFFRSGAYLMHFAQLFTRAPVCTYGMKILIFEVCIFQNNTFRWNVKFLFYSVLFNFLFRFSVDPCPFWNLYQCYYIFKTFL